MEKIGSRAGWPLRSEVADAFDVRSSYRLFLGRHVESGEALRAKLGRPICALAADFLHSEEFIAGVAKPILLGRAAQSDRFAGVPDAALRRWAEHRLLGHVAGVFAVRTAESWTALWRAIISDLAIAAIVDEGLGAGEARALAQALELRADGLSEASARPPVPGLAAERTPSLSIVLASASGDDILAACALVDPELPVRSELLIVDGEARRVGGLAWLDALQDAGRPVQHVSTSPTRGVLLSALEAARGEYLVLDSGGMEPSVLVNCARGLVVHDRPEALQSGSALLIRSDACARALRLAGGRIPRTCDLAKSVASAGGRVEALGVAEPEEGPRA